MDPFLQVVVSFQNLHKSSCASTCFVRSHREQRGRRNNLKRLDVDAFLPSKPSEQAKSILTSKCSVFQTNALFIIFLVWSKEQAFKPQCSTGTRGIVDCTSMLSCYCSVCVRCGFVGRVYQWSGCLCTNRVSRRRRISRTTIHDAHDVARREPSKPN